MQFVRVSNILDGARPLSERLVAELSAGKQVLWLVPGGSNIPLSAAVSHLIPEQLTENLTVMLTDERYGEVGHGDSNTVQLETAGFRAGRSTFHAVLQQGLSLEATTERYARDFDAAAARADIIIGQFGMGPDGHMAGMLPGSGAVTSADLAFGYQAPGYVRITLTPPAVARIGAAYVFAFGEEKREALTSLHDKDLDLSQQPAQIIKQLPESYVYNDLIS
jgi:6-phosphogluconolactonase/glucosamine-6-phosphate isomerase/deaminase